MWADRYFEAARERLAEAQRANEAPLAEAARSIADSLAAEGLIYAFGAGHSAMLVMDIFYRAGGLVPVQPIFSEKILLNLLPVTATTEWEKREGWAGALLAPYEVRPHDVLIAISTSGRNAAPIEVARAGREAGMTVIALTSVSYAEAAPATHSSGKRLHEFADIILDNRVDPGDAALELPGLEQRVGPLSTIVGSALLQATLVQAEAELLARGVTPPVFRSANLPGGRSHNEALLARYRGRVRYLDAGEESV